MKNKMVKIALGLALFIGSVSGAFAESPHPCTPTVRAEDSYMACRDKAKDVYYSIIFQTLMSDLRLCPYQDPNYTEITTAIVSITDANKPGYAVTMTIAPGYFNSKQSTHNAEFRSDIIGLDLRGCSMPLNGGGGLSGGNRN